MAYTGFQEPCACGSGKKYEDCCFIKDATEFMQGDGSAIGQRLKEMAESGKFSSLQEAQVSLDRLLSDWNHSPLDDFCGLSPYQMTRLLYDPFGPESPARYNLELSDFPETPFLRILRLLLTGLSPRGLKTTAKGNLPRNFCQESARIYYGEEGYREKTRYGGFRQEQDWGEIHTVRLTAEMAGFVKKERGRFRLTRKGEQAFSRGLNGKFFLDLFKAYTRKFNWAYRDRWPEINLVQDSFLFTLFCLHQFGDVVRPETFYGDLFLRAFPKVLNEVPQGPYWSPEEQVQKCFSLRALDRFAGFFGFAEIRRPDQIMSKLPIEVKKKPFLDLWIHFKVE